MVLSPAGHLSPCDRKTVGKGHSKLTIRPARTTWRSLCTNIKQVPSELPSLSGCIFYNVLSFQHLKKIFIYLSWLRQVLVGVCKIFVSA